MAPLLPLLGLESGTHQAASRSKAIVQEATALAAATRSSCQAHISGQILEQCGLRRACQRWMLRF